MQNPFDTQERSAFRETVRRYVESEITPNVDEWDEAGGDCEEIMRDLAVRQMGLSGGHNHA